MKEIVNFVENSNVLIIIMLLLCVMSVQFVFLSQKYNKLKSDIEDAYITQLREKIEWLLSEFVVVLEEIPSQLRFNETDTKKFFIELGSINENVKVVTKSGLLLPQKAFWAFEMYNSYILNNFGYTFAQEKTSFALLRRFCDQVQSLAGVDDVIVMLQFLKRGNGTLEKNFQEAKTLLTEFGEIPNKFIEKRRDNNV